MLLRYLAVPFAVLSLHFSAAYADSSAHAAITAARIQLVDLDPLDGIAPSLTLKLGTHASFTVLAANDGLFLIDFGEIGTSLARDATGIGYTTTAQITSGDPYSESSNWGGSAFSAATGNVAYVNAQATLLYGEFVISPKSSLIITGTASVTETATGLLDYAGGSANISISVGTTYLGDVLATSVYNGIHKVYGDPTLSITWDNTSDSTVAGLINFEATVSVSSVPESSSGLLLGFGLPLLGICCRMGARKSNDQTGRCALAA